MLTSKRVGWWRIYCVVAWVKAQFDVIFHVFFCHKKPCLHILNVKHGLTHGLEEIKEGM